VKAGSKKFRVVTYAYRLFDVADTAEIAMSTTLLFYLNRIVLLSETGIAVFQKRKAGSAVETESTWKDGVTLILRNTTTAAIQETQNAWPQHIDLYGFIYWRLGGLNGQANILSRGSILY